MIIYMTTHGEEDEGERVDGVVGVGHGQRPKHGGAHAQGRREQQEPGEGGEQRCNHMRQQQDTITTSDEV